MNVAPTVSSADLATAKRILSDNNITGITDRSVEKLIRQCHGRSWGGSPKDWAKVLRGTVALFVGECERNDAMPSGHELYINRKQWVRAYASQAELFEWPEVVLYEVPEMGGDVLPFTNVPRKA